MNSTPAAKDDTAFLALAEAEKEKAKAKVLAEKVTLDSVARDKDSIKQLLSSIDNKGTSKVIASTLTGTTAVTAVSIMIALAATAVTALVAILAFYNFGKIR